MSAEDLMKYAESFFNPDGSRIHKRAPTVNAVKTSNNNNNNTDNNVFTSPFAGEDDEADINAVGGRFARARQNNNNSSGNYNNSRSKSRGRPFNNNNGNKFGNNNGSFPQNNNNSASASRQHDPSLCYYHNKFGNNAKRCDFGCSKRNQGNGPSPRQQ